MDYNVTWRKKDKGWQFIISYKDSDGKWKQKSKQGFKTQKDGKPIVEKMVQDLKIKSELDVPKEFDNITFKEFTDMFLKHAKLTLEQNTVNGYKTMQLKFKDLNNLDMQKIKPVHIQNIVDGMVTINKVGTIKTYVQRLHSLFKIAMDHYVIISKNPVVNIKYKSTVATRERKALNLKQSSDLLAKIKNDNYYNITLIALECGLRIGEIIGLTWSDINLIDKTIIINKQWKVIKDGVYGFGSVKSKQSNRIVPMSKAVYKSLNACKVRNINGRIFNYKNTSAIAADLRRLYVKLGYEVTVHELRHTYATKLISNGLDFKTVAKLMGHDVEQTMRTYSHVTDEMLDRAFELIQNI